MASINSKDFQVADRIISKNIITHTRYQHYICSQTCACDRLICSLTTAAHLEAWCFKRFAGVRHAIYIGHKIHHIGANHSDLSGHESSFEIFRVLVFRLHIVQRTADRDSQDARERWRVRPMPISTHCFWLFRRDSPPVHKWMAEQRRQPARPRSQKSNAQSLEKLLLDRKLQSHRHWEAVTSDAFYLPHRPANHECRKPVQDHTVQAHLGLP